MNADATPETLAQAWAALDWLCRVHTPVCLRLAGLDADARALEACPPVTDEQSAGHVIQRALDNAHAHADQLREAVRVRERAGRLDAGWDAAWEAALCTIRPHFTAMMASNAALTAAMGTKWRTPASGDST